MSVSVAFSLRRDLDGLGCRVDLLLVCVLALVCCCVAGQAVAPTHAPLLHIPSHAAAPRSRQHTAHFILRYIAAPVVHMRGDAHVLRPGHYILVFLGTRQEKKTIIPKSVNGILYLSLEQLTFISSSSSSSSKPLYSR